MRSLNRLVRQFRCEETGSVATLFGVGFIPLGLLVGAAVDYSSASKLRTHLQAVADSAAIAGAKQYAAGALSNMTPEAAAGSFVDSNLEGITLASKTVGVR
jgi:Flp pilus assembly protein TadG